jgi:Acetyltransferases
MYRVREAEHKDLDGLLDLYTQLHHNPVPDKDNRLVDIWDSIIGCRCQHIIVATVDDVIVSSCTLIMVQNLTQGQRPYAWIENVVTSNEHRNKGLATACLDLAKEMAMKAGCYKIMLMTGVKGEGIEKFYADAGYNKNDKRAFVQWLPDENGEFHRPL